MKEERKVEAIVEKVYSLTKDMDLEHVHDLHEMALGGYISICHMIHEMGLEADLFMDFIDEAMVTEMALKAIEEKKEEQDEAEALYEEFHHYNGE